MHRSTYVLENTKILLNFLLSICGLGTARSQEACSRASLGMSSNRLKFCVFVDVVIFFTDDFVNVNQYTFSINKPNHGVLNT